jgi:hypothetical protein
LRRSAKRATKGRSTIILLGCTRTLQLPACAEPATTYADRKESAEAERLLPPSPSERVPLTLQSRGVPRGPGVAYS